MLNTILYLVGSIITVLCIFMCILLFITHKSKDKNGNRIELENKSREKPWSLRTWIAGVFVAGTGVALMYAPSDLIGFVNNGLNPLESILMMTLLNGIPVWALYSVMGLWYMKHMDSKIGKIAAMLSTIFGMSISLWTGTNTIVKFIGLEFPGLKFLIASIIIIVALVSAKNNYLKKISEISFLVFIIAFLIIIATPVLDIKLSNVTGSITKNFWKEYFVGETTASWIFWFLSWTPTVARWLAHISKGRTMREYISGTIIIPTILALIWMTCSWIYQDVIIGFNLVTNISSLIPCIIFVISGMLFMIGTLDSDCKVFTEDLEKLTNNKLKRKATIPYYGLFVLLFFSLFISGLITKPFAFNEYSSLIFIPLIVWSLFECIKLINNQRSKHKNKLK